MRTTKADLQTRMRQTEKERDLYMLALHDTINAKVEQFGHYKVNDERYVFTASRLDAACGGLFMISFSCNGQSVSTSVSYLDDAYQAARNGFGSTPEAHAQHEAILRAVAKRSEVLNHA